MNAQITRVKHLLWRAGFGPDPERWPRWRQLAPGAVLDELLASSQAGELPPLAPLPPLGRPRQMSPEERQAFNQSNRQALLGLNAGWLGHMVRTRDVLREKMVLFWHDHIACRLTYSHLVQRQQAVFRQHALGTFGAPLHAIARDSGMLQFLNNQQNRKAHPNENFARELRELFTLGRGHYTEAAVQAAARAFTGWGFNREGAFVFRRAWHDDGPKTFLGKTGPWDGDDILRILLTRRHTAYFLTEKLYRYFVHPEPDVEQVAVWAEAFYASG
ncbi:MAG: DUF1800 family protein, partial [Bacteroidetes bacterium]